MPRIERMVAERDRFVKKIVRLSYFIHIMIYSNLNDLLLPNNQ